MTAAASFARLPAERAVALDDATRNLWNRRDRHQQAADTHAMNDDPALARLFQIEADGAAAQDGARMGGNDLPEIRVTDEASWLDYERERMIRQSDRKSAAEMVERAGDDAPPPPEAEERDWSELVASAVEVVTYAAGGALVFGLIVWGIPLACAAIAWIGGGL